MQGHGRGRHVLEVAIRLPRNLSGDQLDLIRRLQDVGL